MVKMKKILEKYLAKEKVSRKHAGCRKEDLDIIETLKKKVKETTTP